MCSVADAQESTSVDRGYGDEEEGLSKQWRLSPRRDAAPHNDAATEEVRIPLSPFHAGEHRSDIELVLSGVEGEGLLAGLRAALTASAKTTLSSGPEVAR